MFAAFAEIMPCYKYSLLILYDNKYIIVLPRIVLVDFRVVEGSGEDSVSLQTHKYLDDQATWAVRLGDAPAHGRGSGVHLWGNNLVDSVG